MIDPWQRAADILDPPEEWRDFGEITWRSVDDDRPHQLGTIELPDAFRFLLDPELGAVRYRVPYGGRGGAKSWSIARVLLLLAAERRLRVLCAREYQTTIRDSVHRLLADQVHKLGLQDVYHVTQTRIFGINGSEFLFLGIKKDPHTIKSLEGIDLCWVEEAEAVTDESWRVLIPTIRAEGSEIWVSFNPALEIDPTYQRFVIDPPESAIVRKVGWADNPWFTDALRGEREDLLRRDPEAEGHVWGGDPWSRSDEQVLSGRWRVEEFEPVLPYTDDDGEYHAPWGEPLYGADWGFARDPNVLVRVWTHDSRLLIDYDVRGIEWSNDETNRRFRRVPGAEDYVIRGDSARPETIAALCRRGLRVESAPKWPGSVEDGVEHLREEYDQIWIHPRCKGLITEARLWRYKVDSRTGDILPKLQDGNDHGWDATRYALAPLIRQRKAIRVL